MRIVSWNVAGLSRVVKEAAFHYGGLANVFASV
jgi:exonuclease III